VLHRKLAQAGHTENLFSELAGFGRHRRRRTYMATIGNFTKQDGSFAGSLTTLTVKAKVTISPIDKTSEKAPDFRVYAGNAMKSTGPSSA
jgi:hypothetical protein